jgi:hypothetical protein
MKAKEVTAGDGLLRSFPAKYRRKASWPRLQWNFVFPGPLNP